MEGEVSLGPGANGKLREFWTGFWLAVVTLGVYELWWYYRLNDELRSIGRLLDVDELARSWPFLSVSALALGLLAVLPEYASTPLLIAAAAAFVASLVSQYRFGRRIRCAEERLGLPESERFKPYAVLLVFPGNLLVIPYVYWFAYVTRHQNALVDGAADLARARTAVAA